jgi:hypothetical protein
MTQENKLLTDSIMFVYHMLEKEPSELGVESEELQKYILEIQKDTTLLSRVDDICFELLTALQDEYRFKVEAKLRDVCYEDIVELVGKLCVFLLGKTIESRVADIGSLEDGEVSESVIDSLPQEEEEVLAGTLYWVGKKSTLTNFATQLEKCVAKFMIVYVDTPFRVFVKPALKERMALPDEVSGFTIEVNATVPDGYVWVCIDG